MMQITYQKQDGCIIQRLRNTRLPYKIGDTTSMGWKVLNIEYMYKNKYYSERKYYMLIHKNKQLFIKKNQTIKVLKREIIIFLYCLISITIINYLRILFNV